MSDRAVCLRVLPKGSVQPIYVSVATMQLGVLVVDSDSFVNKSSSSSNSNNLKIGELKLLRRLTFDTDIEGVSGGRATATRAHA